MLSNLLFAAGPSRSRCAPRPSERAAGIPRRLEPAERLLELPLQHLGAELHSSADLLVAEVVPVAAPVATRPSGHEGRAAGAAADEARPAAEPRHAPAAVEAASADLQRTPACAGHLGVRPFWWAATCGLLTIQSNRLPTTDRPNEEVPVSRRAMPRRRGFDEHLRVAPTPLALAR